MISHEEIVNMHCPFAIRIPQSIFIAIAASYFCASHRTHRAWGPAFFQGSAAYEEGEALFAFSWILLLGLRNFIFEIFFLGSGGTSTDAPLVQHVVDVALLLLGLGWQRSVRSFERLLLLGRTIIQTEIVCAPGVRVCFLHLLLHRINFWSIVRLLLVHSPIVFSPAVLLLILSLWRLVVIFEFLQEIV